MEWLRCVRVCFPGWVLRLGGLFKGSEPNYPVLLSQEEAEWVTSLCLWGYCCRTQVDKPKKGAKARFQ